MDRYWKRCSLKTLTVWVVQPWLNGGGAGDVAADVSMKVDRKKVVDFANAPRLAGDLDVIMLVFMMSNAMGRQLQ